MTGRSIEVSCSCGRRLRAVIADRPPGVHLFAIATKGAVADPEPLRQCPNCQRAFSGLTAEQLREDLGAHWS